MPSSALIVGNEGRVGIATMLKNGSLYMAIGGLSGTTPWDAATTPPNFPATGIKLESEYARKVADLINYITVDDYGDIIAENGATYSATDTPTSTLLARFLFAPPAVQTTLYQYAAFLNTVPNMAKAQMTFAVNHSGGYLANETKLQVDTLVGGTLNDLLPVPNPRPGYGRKITFTASGATDYRITAVDFSSSIITIAPPLSTGAPLSDNQILTSPAISGTPAGQKQLAPAEVFNPGDLFLGRNISPLIMSPGTRTQFDLLFAI